MFKQGTERRFFFQRFRPGVDQRFAVPRGGDSPSQGSEITGKKDGGGIRRADFARVKISRFTIQTELFDDGFPFDVNFIARAHGGYYDACRNRFQCR